MAKILKEMAQLFPDKAFHLGLDETRSIGKCTAQSE